MVDDFLSYTSIATDLYIPLCSITHLPSVFDYSLMYARCDVYKKT